MSLSSYIPAIIAGSSVVAFVGAAFFVTDSGPSTKIDLFSPKTHVIITGGSSGIGLATASMLRKMGCSVTIIARNLEKLNEAKAHIDGESAGKSGCLDIVSADVSDRNKIKEAVSSCCKKHGNRVDVLIMSAGVSRPGKVEDVGDDMHEKMIHVNYFGSLYSTLAVLPFMKDQCSGRLVYVCSLAALAPLTGLAGYSASKLAVKGLAESLHMELKPFDIYTSLVNPPDVDTPMLQEEMQWKPEDCKIISSDGGLFTADSVAVDIIAALRSWRFMVNTGMDGWLLGLMATNLSTPTHSVLRSMMEVLLAGILRFVSLAYLTSWNRTCKQVHTKLKANLSSNA